MQTTDPNVPQGLDPTAFYLTKAIRQTETQNSPDAYTAQGKSGEYGAYQYMPDTWAQDSQSFLGQSVPINQATPEQQNEVAYKKVESLLKQGYSQSQVASIWNSNKPDPNATGTGQNAEGADYNVPAYVDKVKQNYLSYQNQNKALGTQAPAATLPNQSSQNNISTTLTAPATPPESLLQKAGDVAKGIGNFLFPAVGDIYNDITGQNKKTVLQQAGDVGLTALPFIPGLGEAGEAARGAEAGAEGAGLLSKLAGSAVTKGAGVGYGAGVASNLSQGQSIGQSLTPGLNTIGGAVLGGGAPLALKGLGSVLEKMSGIDPQVLNDLKTQTYSQDELNKYMGAAKTNAANVRAPNQFDAAGDDLDAATNKIDQNAQKAGRLVGQANKAGASISLQPEQVAPVAQRLNEELDSRFGTKIAHDADGKLTLVPTREGAPALTSTEQSRILDVASRINNFANSGNVQMADDLMTTLDKKVDYGTASDPLQGMFKTIRGQVNSVARDASPEYAAANDRLSSLKGLQDQVRSMAGKENQRGIGLMKRVFSGDKSGATKGLFEDIKNETGIDLTKSAVLAKLATDTVGSKGQKSLLEKALEEAQTGGGGLYSAAFNLAKHGAQKLASPERVAKNAISGKGTGLLGNMVTKAAARVGASASGLQSIVQ